MKLISLNTWGGRVGKPFREFIKKHSKDIDIFCLQEIYHEAKPEDAEPGEIINLFNELRELLPDFNGYFTPQLDQFGLAIFIKKPIKAKIDSCTILSAKDVDYVKMSDGSNFHPRVLQEITLSDVPLTIYNFHGIPGGEKKDNSERELQTKRLRQVLSKAKTEKILVGDFNLNPDTRSVAELERTMKNLVKEGGFKTTRTSFYAKQKLMPFADYTFVTKDVSVDKFEVLKDEVSDHSPMFLEFSL